MRFSPGPFRTLLLSFILALAAQLVRADPSGQVGRIGYLEGSATLYPEHHATGQPARLNWPVVEGAVLETGRASRAEIWIGSTTLRLAGDSRLEFAVLDDNRVSLRLTAGTIGISLRDPEQARELELATPNSWARFDSTGQYRVDVGPQRSNFATLAGRTLILRNGEQLAVPSGQTASVDSRSADLYGLPLRDDFDDWSASREALDQNGRARFYVSPRMTGYQDLDRYGDWASTPDYGSLWFPRDLPYGWAPYQQGQWIWVSPWGWTWVDDSPWGFAPFHYGRWLEISGRWAWSPGAYVSRPIYAPALVTWIERPDGRSSRGPGARWAPLAPSQAYVPPYRASVGHVELLNRGWSDHRNTPHNWHDAPGPHRPLPARRETQPPAPDSQVHGYQRQDAVTAPSVQRPSGHEPSMPPRVSPPQPPAPNPAVTPMPFSGQPEMRWQRQETARPAPLPGAEGRPGGSHETRREQAAPPFRPAETSPPIPAQPAAPPSGGEHRAFGHGSERGGERGERNERRERSQ